MIIKTEVDDGLIKTKLKKANGSPTIHLLCRLVIISSQAI
jgi:hypothetical protein